MPLGAVRCLHGAYRACWQFGVIPNIAQRLLRHSRLRGNDDGNVYANRLGRLTGPESANAARRGRGFRFRRRFLATIPKRADLRKPAVFLLLAYRAQRESE
jgi:hypothetical protein